MPGNELSYDQANVLYKQLRDVQGYTHNLKVRLAELNFADDDPLVITANRANDAMLDLSQYVHYLACNKPLWWKPRILEELQSPHPHDQPKHHGNQRRGD